MTKTEARKCAKLLFLAGITNVRIVEDYNTGEMSLLVQRNNVVLESHNDVAEFVRRWGRAA
jgi:hypothetical protein